MEGEKEENEVIIPEIIKKNLQDAVGPANLLLLMILPLKDTLIFIFFYYYS